MKIRPLGLLAIGFIVGLLVMYLYFQPKLTYQGKTAQQWASLSNQYQKWATEWKQTDFSDYYQLRTLQRKPTPTPKIVYQTQTVTPQPIEYQTINGGKNVEGSNGSFCTYINNGKELECSGGN